MKYCINFYGNNSDIYNKVDEINIPIDKIKLDEIIEFCQQHNNQRINLCINDWNEGLTKGYIDYCLSLDLNNIFVRLPNWDEAMCMAIKEKYSNKNIYFGTMINNWDTIITYLNYGVTDLIITESLGFELDKIAKMVHDKNIQIRVFPNVAQSIYKDSLDKLKFWIRPEDIPIYEPYVDVCEFYGEENKQEIYYNIYAEDKKWSGSLGEIIIGLSDEINSMTLAPRFAEARIKCERKCMKGSPCRICEHMIELSQTLEKANLRITLDNDKEDIENNG